jgi:hypothetical protein
MKLLSGGLYWALIQKVIWKFRCKKRRKVASTEMDYDEFVERQAAKNFDISLGYLGINGTRYR